MGLSTAFSPCPNDTFLMHAWVENCFESSLSIQPHYADIQELNQLALKGEYPLIKISIALLPRLIEDYILLPVGAALGRACGPLVISREPLNLDQLHEKRVAIPGKETTAHGLFKALVPNSSNKVFCLYHEVIEKILSGEVDAGVIIHETRFTYRNQTLHKVCDLGELWEEKYNLPIPLGGFVAKRQLGNQISQIVSAMKESLDYAYQYPKAGEKYRLDHSIEKDPTVIQNHIDLYVNSETKELSEEGHLSIEKLIGQPIEVYR